MSNGPSDDAIRDALERLEKWEKLSAELVRRMLEDERVPQVLKGEPSAKVGLEMIEFLHAATSRLMGIACNLSGDGWEVWLSTAVSNAEVRVGRAAEKKVKEHEETIRRIAESN